MNSAVLSLAGLALLSAACDAARSTPPETLDRCQQCHGEAAGNPAPPRSLGGATDRTARGVGAHQVHVQGGPVRGPLDCGECHPLPDAQRPMSHPDGRLEVVFGELGRGGGSPIWSGNQLTCSATYCHGGSLGAGGSLTVPVWTAVDGAASACGACHGAPPPPPHPADSACTSCHPQTARPDGTIDLASGTHLNGSVEVTGLSCQSCHGGRGNSAPPVGTRGETATTSLAVGAHQAHVRDGSIHAAFACDACHPVPAQPLHSDGTVTIAFGNLAQSGGASPAWSRGSASCAATYCHGATLAAGGVATAPVWTRVDGSQRTCDACHGFPPPAPHPYSSACASCHPQTVRPDGSIDLAGGTHVNGSVEVIVLSCQSCHGGNDNDAPPLGTRGETATTSLAVGAHQAHVRDGSIHAAFACDACHPVPTQPLHSDGTVTIAFGGLAQSDGASPTWSGNQLTCSATYCHGATLAAGGVATAPVWTRVDGSQRTCDACHGAPPATVAGRPHPASSACRSCHPDTIRADGNIDVAGGKHINGALDVRFSCDSCHGAPPPTGAHLAHARPPRLTGMDYGQVTVLEDVALVGDDPVPYAFGCGQCHPTDPARHLDGLIQVDLSPAGAPAGTLKSRNRADASWSVASGTCSGVACHSSGQASPAFAAVPAWSATGDLPCSSCHDDPPRYPSGGPGAPDANGHLQLQADGYEWGHFGGLPGPWHTSYHGLSPGSLDAAPITCQACHAGTVDPAATAPGGFFWLNTTGDYQLPGGFLGYRCGDCHGVPGGPPIGQGRVRALKHVNGQRDVEFDGRTDLPVQPWLPAPPNRPTRPYWVTISNLRTAPPPGAVMEGNTLSMNLGAAGWAPATKTCSSVACHLDQTTVVWGAPHPGWNDCNICHPGY